jgi:predicted Zn-dependent protease
MSDPKNCLTMATAAVQHGTELGLTAIEVHIERTSRRAVMWESTAVVSAASMPPKQSVQADVRVYSSLGHVGTASGSASSTSALHRVVAKAIESAKSAAPNPHAGPADGYEQAGVGLGLMDRRSEALDDEAREEAVNENVEDVRSINGVDPVSFEYTEVITERAYCSSTGVSREEKGSHYRLDGTVELSGGGYRASQSVQSRLFADAASLPLGSDLARQVLRYRDPQPRPEGVRPVVIEPAVAAKIILAVIPAFSRSSVESGTSFLGDGRRIGSDKLHMIDDGLTPGGLNTRSFDRRGVPSIDLPLIREGAVGALYQSVEMARSLDGRPCGHQGAKGVWSGNLILRPGTRSRNMIYPDIGRYLVLDSLIDDGKSWFNLKHGKVRLKGHFFSGIAGSAPVYVGVHTIDTTFVELWSGIREIANDQRRFDCVDVSSWVVEGLSLV